MKSIYIFFAFILFISTQLIAQFVVDWESTWNSPYSKFDRAEVMNIDSDGNIVVAGTSYSGELNSTGDVAIVKYLPDGTEMWNKRFNIGSYDEALGIYFDAANNIVVGVKGADSSIYNPSFMIIKYDSDGNLLSAKKAWLYINGYNVTGKADKLHRDNYNNLIVGGLVANNIWMIKFDLNGNVTESLTDFIVDTLVFSSYLSYLDKTNSELTLPMQSWHSQGKYFLGALQLNNDASPRWFKRLLSNSNGYELFCNGIIKNSSGNTLIGIKNSLWNQGLQKHISDQHIMKLDNDGLILWDRVLEAVPDKISELNDFSLDNEGNLLVTGTTKHRYFTSRYSPAGELNLFIQYEDTTMYSGIHVLPAENGKFYIILWDLSGSVYVVKYDDFGNEIQRIKLQGLSEYFPLELQQMMFDPSKKLVLTGGKYFGGSYDFVTMKITDQLTDVEDEQSVVSDFNLYQNYPNPFNPSTTIKYSVPKIINNQSSIINIKVYDVLGNEIATLVNEEKSAGTYEVEFNAARFASGIYFYRLTAGENVQTKKLVLLK